MQFWKPESIPYCLSHRIQQSNEYLIHYTMSKTVEIDKNVKNHVFQGF